MATDQKPIKAPPTLLKRISDLASKVNVEPSIMAEVFLKRAADDFEAGKFNILPIEPKDEEGAA